MANCTTVSDRRHELGAMFHDRSDAGRQLAAKLVHLKQDKPIVLALPRGGVPVGFEIARALDAPLDLILVRKIGAPWQPELAVGAVTDGDDPEIFIDRRLTLEWAISDYYVSSETRRQLKELERRRLVYGAGRTPLEIAGRPAIVVDDGIATGATMRVALGATRRRENRQCLCCRGPCSSGRRTWRNHPALPPSRRR